MNSTRPTGSVSEPAGAMVSELLAFVKAHAGVLAHAVYAVFGFVMA